jgi:hypothetical protein
LFTFRFLIAEQLGIKLIFNDIEKERNERHKIKVIGQFKENELRKGKMNSALEKEKAEKVKVEVRRGRRREKGKEKGKGKGKGGEKAEESTAPITIIRKQLDGENML